LSVICIYACMYVYMYVCVCLCLRKDAVKRRGEDNNDYAKAMSDIR
jgi:hypothetical protein